MKSLTEIANSYGTDKGTVGPSDAHGGHNYTDIYEAYFSHRRNEPLNFLEIGIGLKRKEESRIAHGRNEGGGASIKMWKEYFPNANIYTIDIVEAKWLDDARTHTFVVDQGSKESIEHFLASVPGIEFDYLIDDGSHNPDHQQLSLGVLFPHLKAGGVYFIEDLYDNGKGDIIKGILNSDRALNTHKVLSGFLQSGKFPEPNALYGKEYLEEHIGGINFHVPIIKVNKEGILKKALGMEGQMITYQPGTELLVALKKK